MIEDKKAEDFANLVRGQVDEMAEEIEEVPALRMEIALAEVFLGYLEEAGTVSGHTLCPHEDQTGRSRCRIIAYSLIEEAPRLEIFTARYLWPGDGDLIGADEIQRLTGRAARFFDYAAAGDFERFKDSPAARDAAQSISAALDEIADVKVYVLTNARVKVREVEPVPIRDRLVEFSIVDIDRLYRISLADSQREPVEVNFREMLGRPLACLEMKPPAKEYDTYLTILPGQLVYDLYERFGPRLLEFNVRSFLQSKGKVNKGLRDTLRQAPERFLAYNNGLAATADEIEVETFHGETAIARVNGLQIVNGGQTTASIHRAKKVDGINLDRIAVAMKLTRVEPGKLAEFVPLIARYANTQNVIQISDLSANNEFHIALERLSEAVWNPGEENRWFYERARGAYQTALMRYGATPAKRKEFQRQCPRANHFTKTDMAKCLMSWWQRPQVVSRGAQKNFSVFMSELPERFTDEWQPDEAFYKKLIALMILFREARALVRRRKFPAYGANVVTYLVARISHDFESGLNLDTVWEDQTLSEKLVTLMDAWSTPIRNAIVDSAGRRNVTEWCKKDDCWNHVRTIALPPAPIDFAELHATSEQDQSPGTALGSRSVTDSVDKCCRVDAKGWTDILSWAARTKAISEFEQMVATTLAGYALRGWKKPPSEKQARIGARIIERARQHGVLASL